MGAGVSWGAEVLLGSRVGGQPTKPGIMSDRDWIHGGECSDLGLGHRGRVRNSLARLQGRMGRQP